MDKEQFRQLLQRYQAGEASEAEKAFVEAYYATFETRPDVIEQLSDAEQQRLEAVLYEDLQQQIRATKPMGRVHLLRRRWVRYAAAVLVIAAIGSYAWFNYQNKQQPFANTTHPLPTDLAPGHDGAILTLANGRQVVLDSMGNGIVAVENGTELLLENGRLAYNATKAGAVSYNTITTPAGRQFHVQLPDGTHAWLNAASAITYPTAFTGNERTIQIAGEAYLEVAKDPRKPFKVKTNDGYEVKVLGTHFNINAYTDEASINTTLLEGSVLVSHGKNKARLQPGQQALTLRSIDHPIQIDNNANIEQVMAWKNGAFSFQNTALPVVMRQLSRWYNIDVEFANDVSNKKITGEMGRNLVLTEMLEGLVLLGVRGEWKDGKLKVTVQK